MRLCAISCAIVDSRRIMAETTGSDEFVVEADEALSAEVVTRLALKTPNGETLISHTVESNGHTFLVCKKSDTSISKLFGVKYWDATAKDRTLSRTSILEDLCSLRNTAADALAERMAGSNAGVESLGDEFEAEADKYQFSEHPIVVVKTPAVQDVPSIDMKILYMGRKSALAMECTTENFTYMRLAVRAQLQHGGLKRKRPRRSADEEGSSYKTTEDSQRQRESLSLGTSVL